MGKLGKSKKSRISIKISGLILSENYQRCKLFAKKLGKYHAKSFQEPLIRGFLEVDWLEHLNKLQKDIGGQSWAIKHGVVIFVDQVFVGGETELFSTFKDYVYLYKNPSVEVIQRSAKEEYRAYLNRNNGLYTYMKFTMDGEYMGTLLFELRPDLLPKTSAWFGLLCQPENYIGHSYKGSNVHRICRSGWFQAGDLCLDNDIGIEDESFCYKHDRRGIISFANEGRGTNQSQFFVTFKPSAWMDAYYVAFGRVVEGSDVLRRIENIECIYESPRKDITISDCGLAEIGFGRTLKRTAKLKIRGITVGAPHVDLDMYVDIILDGLCVVLFERLGDEVKKQCNELWLAEVLWKTVQELLTERLPVGDILDANDKQSQIFLPVNFLAGLYSLREIPDHFIKALIESAVADAVERSDTMKIAESIINFILGTVFNLVPNADEQRMAESILSLLIDNAIENIHGSLISQHGSGTSGDLLPEKIVSRNSSRFIANTQRDIEFTKAKYKGVTLPKEGEISKSLEEISSNSLRESLRTFMVTMLSNSLTKSLPKDN